MNRERDPAENGQFNRNVLGPLLGLVMVLVSAGVADQASTEPEPMASATDAADRVDTVVASLLARIPVVEESSREGYSRDAFPHWSDLDGNGCDTREQVLIDERDEGAVEGCKVVRGTWFSFYDAKVETNPSLLDIDHMVPLAEAWDSDASTWTQERRERYANDLGYEDALVAVSRSSNRSKGDRDPAEWQPEQDAWCQYATAWTTVKIRWDLNADAAELQALRDMFSTCRTPPPTDITPATET